MKSFHLEKRVFALNQRINKIFEMRINHHQSRRKVFRTLGNNKPTCHGHMSKVFLSNEHHKINTNIYK